LFLNFYEKKKKNSKLFFLGLCIGEIFKENEELALKVKESTIQTLVMLLGQHKIYPFLLALNGIARVEYYPLRRNQNFVIKVLSFFPFCFCFCIQKFFSFYLILFILKKKKKSI